MKQAPLIVFALTIAGLTAAFFLLADGNIEDFKTKGYALVSQSPVKTKVPESKETSKPVAKKNTLTAEIPTVTVVPVQSKQLDFTVNIPGEIAPYLSVDIYPKIAGFLDSIEVDRGSRVKKGDILARLVAPELIEQRAEAEAKRDSDRSTYERMTSAAATPGVVALNDLEVAKKNLEAREAYIRSLKEKESYLVITAPFDGTVTERNAHPGALLGPSGSIPLIRLQQVSRLRVVVSVPEAYVSGTVEGKTVNFTVSAYPAETFKGTIARVAQSVDVKTRSMPVELDVMNSGGRLSPGMFPEIAWHVTRPKPTLTVPAKAVAASTERTFVIRVREDTAEWLTVKRGASMGNEVEIFGDLKPNDLVVLGATDELKPGTKVVPKPVAPPPAKT